MTEVEDTHEAHGIKLFGKTIVFHVKAEVARSDDDENKSDEQPSIDKRPDKIIPCPRCKSMETKFCYFNNYNVNQPRHFCKGCQRYWTAGGALRNVPVGAGRRKAKLLAPSTLPAATFPDSCVLVDGAAFEEYWAHVPTVSGGCGGFYPDYPAKRRRNVSYGQPNASSQDV